MPDNSAAKLYSPSLLALSIELAEFPHDHGQPLQGYAKSRTCGSEVTVSCDTSDNGGLRHLGMLVKACAVGQGSAAIMASYAPGRTRADIIAQLEAIEAWLTTDAPPPSLDRWELVEPARAYPARHEAILIPWRAAVDALCTNAMAG
ncbi:iron-sulfur cluster assembly scaffold protein [Erythrobacter sp. MTPC3]|uniref:iron-sulfur cluster assembly scaffold protein n=1 Tax=Erythrobacter sp. MTPC3 TaxID=3056564 RepID=UPI0036F23940